MRQHLYEVRAETRRSPEKLYEVRAETRRSPEKLYEVWPLKSGGSVLFSQIVIVGYHATFKTKGGVLGIERVTRAEGCNLRIPLSETTQTLSLMDRPN